MRLVRFSEILVVKYFSLLARDAFLAFSFRFREGRYLPSSLPLPVTSGRRPMKNTTKYTRTRVNYSWRTDEIIADDAATGFPPLPSRTDDVYAATSSSSRGTYTRARDDNSIRGGVAPFRRGEEKFSETS